MRLQLTATVLAISSCRLATAFVTGSARLSNVAISRTAWSAPLQMAESYVEAEITGAPYTQGGSSSDIKDDLLAQVEFSTSGNKRSVTLCCCCTCTQLIASS
jgi:hypothetical protein